MNRSILFLLFFISIPVLSKSQPINCKTLNLVFIDNSRATYKLGLSDGLQGNLTNVLNNLENNETQKFLVYLCNRNNPKIAKEEDKINAILESILTENQKEPVFALERNNILKQLFKSEYNVTDSLVIHYYLTEEYLVNFVMDKDAGLLLNNFPRELMYLLNLSSNQVYVNINFSNVSKKVDEEKLRSMIDFFNKGRYKISGYKLNRI